MVYKYFYFSKYNSKLRVICFLEKIKKIYIMLKALRYMPIQSKENSWSAWVFLAGVVLAVAIGISASSLLPFEELQKYSKPIYALLVLVGLSVGFLTKISGKESQTFLIAGTVIVLVSKFGMETVNSSLIGIGLVDIVSSTFAALLVLFVPATIVVALKTVFSVSRV